MFLFPLIFHAADIYNELVKLFQRRQLQLVKIPRLERLPTIKAEEGWGYSVGAVVTTALDYRESAIFSSASLGIPSCSNLDGG